MGRVQTYSGLLIDPLELRPEDVRIEDVAHALALRNRWNCATLEPLSVAQHSVLVARVLSSRHGPIAALCGLLHDVGEYVLPDVPAPLKDVVVFHRDGGQVPFAAAEARIRLAAIEGLGLSRLGDPERHSAVRGADLLVRAAEGRELLKYPQDWADAAVQYTDRVVPWHWKLARENFLAMYRSFRLELGSHLDHEGG